MDYKSRLKKLEEAFLPPTKLKVEIVDDGNDIVIIGDGKVIKRTVLGEDGEE